MGQLKQAHIDCYEGECLAPSRLRETCYMQPDNPNYTEPDEDEPEQGHVNTDGDYDPRIDEVS